MDIDLRTCPVSARKEALPSLGMTKWVWWKAGLEVATWPPLGERKSETRPDLDRASLSRSSFKPPVHLWMKWALPWMWKLHQLVQSLCFPSSYFSERVRECFKASLVAQIVKNLPAMQETHIWSLGQEDPLDKGMATHSSILAWRIPWTEELGLLQSMGLQTVGHDWVANTLTLVIRNGKES